MKAKTARPNREAIVLDVEGGLVSARDIKAAREVAESAMSDKEFQRLANRIIDEARDGDASLTRAARDRDRATPRDLSREPSPRLRGELPALGAFRQSLSGRQRKLRSAAKNRVIAAAPTTQRQALRRMLIESDPTQWGRVNAALHQAGGDAQQLDDADRVTVQRLDRMIQTYEQNNDRTHTVYVAVQLPATHRNIADPDDLPTTLQPGQTVAFDQFTVARHSVEEAPGHDSNRHVMLEMTTTRGMYMGQSDTVADTTHLLPRGMSFEVVAADYAVYARAGGYGTRLVVQLREQQP